MSDRTVVDFTPSIDHAYGTSEILDPIESWEEAELFLQDEPTGVYFFGPAAYAKTCPGIEV